MNIIPELQSEFCPYRGLDPFTEANKEYFVGRDADTRLIASNLLGVPLSVLYGVSGVGKSSVLLAGVLPRLRKNPGLAVTVFRHWQEEQFAQQLKRVIAEAVQHNVNRDPKLDLSLPFDEFLLQCNEALDGPVFLIFDQWEEYFLYHPTENSFDLELARAISRRDVTAHFLFAMREEELSKLDRFRTSIPNVLGNMLRLKHLDPEAAEAAIRKPLDVYNSRVPADQHVTIEDELVNSPIEKSERLDEHDRQLTQNNGCAREERQIATPVLQLLLTRLWEEERQRNSTILRAATLERLGGAQNVVDDYFESVIRQLPAEQRALAGRTFGYLVNPAGGKFAQTPATLAHWAKEADEAPIRQLLDGLAMRSDIRILRKIAIEGKPDQYEIYHDVLGPSVLKWQQKFEQEEAERELERVREVVELERKRANELESLNRQLRSIALAVRAILRLALNPADSLEMSLEAARLAYTQEAEDALRQSVAAKLESRLYAVLQGHQHVVTSSIFSPNGDFILTTSADKTAKLWEAQTGRLLRSLNGHQEAVNKSAFSPDGQFILTASDDHTAKIWSSQTGQLLLSLDGHSDFVHSATYSPDGRFIITSSNDRTVRIWSATTGKFLRKCGKHKHPVFSATYSPDGRFIITAGIKIQIRDAETDKLITSLKRKDSDYYFYSAVFSPDQKFILFACADGLARIHGFDGRKIGEKANEFNSAENASFSNDGNLIVTSSLVEAIRVRDARTAKILVEFKGHEHAINDAAFSPNGKYLVTASDDSTARVWRIQSNPEFVQYAGHTRAVGQAIYSQDGSLILTVSDDGRAKIWETATNETVLEVQDGSFRINGANFSPDGKLLATACDNATAKIYETSTGTLVMSLQGHLGAVQSVSFHPNGHHILTASLDKTAIIWDANSGDILHYLDGHENHLYRAVYSASGELIVTASYDISAIVWDATSGEMLARLEGHQAPVLNAAFSPDSRFVVTAGYDKRAFVWSVRGDKFLRELKGHTGQVRTALYSPDGKNIITTCSDNAIRVFNAQTGEKISELNNHMTNVWGASYDPSGKFILTAGNDGIARVFPSKLMAPYEELKKYADGLIRK